jgi:formylmethanofuran dehydrogenase subunit B
VAVVEDTVCSGCSLLCDDVSAEVSGDSVRSLGLCRLGHAHLEAAISHMDLKAIIRQDEKEQEVSVDAALKQASEMLIDSKSVLLFGWSQATNEDIREGLLLASDLKGFFDYLGIMGASQALQHPIHSMQLKTDLEYVRNHGEFIIYWGSDPSESLHRHPSRFAVLPRGEKIPEGIESRRIGIVDVRQTETMKMANHRLIIPNGSDAELLDAITSEISGSSSISGPVAGIPASELIGLVRGLQNSDCTAIFYGSGLLNSGAFEANLNALKKFIEAIRATGKEAFALPMFQFTNAMGAARVAIDTTSWPCSVDYSSGTAVFDASTNALRKLVANDFDTVVIVGDDPFVAIPGPAVRALAATKILYIGPPRTVADRLANVSIHVRDMMFQETSTATRLDQVEVTIQGLSEIPSDMTSAGQILSRIRDAIKSKR